MNKILLTFENKYLEQSYQDDRQSIITTPIMKLVLFFSLGYCIVDVSLAIVNKDYFQITIKLLLMGMIIVDIIILIFKQKWIRVALMISNIIVMVHQLDMNYECDKNRAYIYGSNLMIINLLLINESDFRCAVIQILALYIIRIGIAFSSTQLPVQPHIFTILLSVIVIYNCYQKESQNRRKYLLHVKDIQYGKLILKLLKEPFFISTFDKEKLKLKIILTNTVGGAYEHFLCKAKVDNQSITNYIYKNMKQELNNDDFVQQYFIAYYFDKKYEIQLSEYFLDQPVFQIVVQTVNERESKLIQSFNKQYDRYLEFLKMITTMIQKYKRRRQHSQLQKLQYTMIEYYSYQRTKYRELQIKEIDLYIFLRNTFRQFYMNNLNNRHPYQIQRDANVVIQSDKQILNIFSCLILRNVIQLDTLKLTNIRNCIQVTILGDYHTKIEMDKSLQYLYKQGLISDYFFGAQTQIYMITKRLGHY